MIIKGNKNALEDKKKKVNLTLLYKDFHKELSEVGRVLDFGAQKHGERAYRKLEYSKDVYISAMFRHLNAYFDGEKLDIETGESHLAHALCCLLMLFYKDRM